MKQPIELSVGPNLFVRHSSEMIQYCNFSHQQQTQVQLNLHSKGIQAFYHLFSAQVYQNDKGQTFIKFKLSRQYPIILLRTHLFPQEKPFGRQQVRDVRGGRNFNITFIQKMGRKRVKGTKYNRVTKQQKYVFLKLCITEKQSIHEAAYNAGIHYSTAKTILFFHKKQYKNYSTYIVEDPNAKPSNPNLLTATWIELPIDVDQERIEPCRIEIVVNSKKKMLEERMKNREKTDSTSDGKPNDPFGVKIEYDDFQFDAQNRKNSMQGEQQGDFGIIKKEMGESVPNFDCPPNFFY